VEETADPRYVINGRKDTLIMRKIVLIAAAATAALALASSASAKSTSVAADWDKSDGSIVVAKAEVVLAADIIAIDRAAALAPRLTYAVLHTTTSPQALALGLARPSTKSIV